MSDTMEERIRQLELENERLKEMAWKDAYIVEKVGEWFSSAYEAIYAAGGAPNRVLSLAPARLLTTLARNNIRLQYVRPKEGEENE